MLKNTFIKKAVSAITVAAIGVGASVVHIELAFAASLSSLSNTQSSVQVSTLSNHTIQFVTPTGITAGQGISITFPAEYATGTFAIANFDFATSTSASCVSFQDAAVNTSASGQTWGISQATSTIYILSATAVIPANRCVQIEIGSNATFGATGVSQITNPASPGLYEITIGGTFGDSGSISTYIISDDTVSMTGTVQQSLTFTISTTTIYFGNLGSGGAKFASSTNTAGDTIETIAHTLAIATNAPSGYNITIRGDTLTSQQNALNTITAIGASIASSTIATEQFGIRATVSGGTGAAVDATYSAATSYGFDASSTTPSTLATGSGSTNTSTYSLRYVANIAGTTEAGTYVASLIYVATANY